MNIEPLGRDADLRAVEEGAEEDLLRDIVEVDVGHDNRGIVAAEFERQALQVLGGAFHHALAGRGRAGERDFGEARMRGHLRPAFVPARADVAQARGADVLQKTTHLEHAERGEGRWLEEDRKRTSLNSRNKY